MSRENVSNYTETEIKLHGFKNGTKPSSVTVAMEKTIAESEDRPF